MMDNIMTPLLEGDINVLRVNVLFGRPTEFIDGMIGRHAHIRLLDSPLFSKMFVELYSEYLS